ncbi:MAG: YggT family protein [Desulfarculales bacterium]|jgi:YggT family protein|nr:YggT family protein [Desulfarculales bacterium]
MQTLLNIISTGLLIYMWVVVFAALITWVNPDPHNFLVQLLYRATAPVLGKIRRLIPTNLGGLDIAPLLLILAIIFIREVVLTSIMLNFYIQS